MKTVLCILTRNEIDCIKIIFPQIPQPGAESGFDEIYAIDGGSTDGTVEYFKSKNIPVIGQSKRGRGEAFLLAFQNINADSYIFFSPDGNEAIEDLRKFKLFISEGNDLVIASRMMEGSFNEEDVHWWRPRKWANKFFNFLANFFFRKHGPYVHDSINGYRALTKSAVNKLKLTASDYTIEYQMTIRAFKNNLKIKEFPTIEGQRVAGDTGAPNIPTGLKFFKRFFKELRNID